MKSLNITLFGALTLASFAGYAQSAGLTDPQIAAIVVSANQVDIDAGKLADEVRLEVRLEGRRGVRAAHDRRP